MNKYRIENPNNNKVREYKSRTTDVSTAQFLTAQTIDQKIEAGFDIAMGGMGFIPVVGSGISLYWGTIGKPLAKMHAKNINEQMKMGINPGLPASQPFK